MKFGVDKSPKKKRKCEEEDAFDNEEEETEQWSEPTGVGGLFSKGKVELDAELLDYDSFLPEEQATIKSDELKGHEGLVYDGKYDTKIPKYMEALRARAKKREMEREIVRERLMKKELEENAEEQITKEVFVTGAFKRKMAERKKLEDQLEREEEMDQRRTAQAHSDMDTYYRNMMKKGVFRTRMGT